MTMPKWIEEMAAGAVVIFGVIIAGAWWRRKYLTGHDVLPPPDDPT